MIDVKELLIIKEAQPRIVHTTIRTTLFVSVPFVTWYFNVIFKSVNVIVSASLLDVLPLVLANQAAQFCVELIKNKEHRHKFVNG